MTTIQPGPYGAGSAPIIEVLDPDLTTMVELTVEQVDEALVLLSLAFVDAVLDGPFDLTALQEDHEDTVSAVLRANGEPYPFSIEHVIFLSDAIEQRWDDVSDDLKVIAYQAMERIIEQAG